MLIVLMGKSCSGKDTIAKELIKNNNFKKIITYTTRPIRDGEKQDETYHFVSEEEFIDKLEDGFFFEHKSYNSVHGIWYYGTSKESIKQAEESTDKYVIILTPSGVKEFKEANINCNVVYINCPKDLIASRLIHRGDNAKEAKRRMDADDKDFDFNNIHGLYDCTIQNDGLLPIKTIAEIINVLTDEDKESD